MKNIKSQLILSSNDVSHKKKFSASLTDWLMVSVILLLPVKIFVTKEIHVAPADWVVTLAYPFLLPKILNKTFRRRLLRPALVAIVLVIMISLLITATEQEVSSYALVNKTLGIVYLVGFYLFVASYAVQSRDAILTITRSAAAAAALHTVIGLVGFFRKWKILYNDPCYPRLSGLSGAPAVMGMILTCSFLLELSGLSRHKPLLGRWSLMTTPLALVGVVLTFSRSAFVGAIAGFATLAVLLQRRLHSGLIALIPGAVLSLVFLGLSLVYESGTDPRETVTYLLYRQRTVTSRLEQYSFALETLVDKPLLGAGLGEAKDALGSVVHSTYLWLATEAGILGLLAGLWVVSTFLFSGWYWWRGSPPAYRHLSAGWLASFLCYAIASMFTELFYQRHLWLVMAVLAAGRALADQEGNGPAIGTAVPARAVPTAGVNDREHRVRM